MVKKICIPSSVLNKTHKDLCYHGLRRDHAARTLRVGCILGEYNIADLLTKTTMAGNMRLGMVELLFYNKSVVIRDKCKI